MVIADAVVKLLITGCEMYSITKPGKKITKHHIISVYEQNCGTANDATVAETEYFSCLLTTT